jgi:hypothetical protein
MSSLTVLPAQVTIMGIVVRVLDGLYSLNDLHRASGGDPKHKPANFMRVEVTKDLINEIDRCSDMSNGIKSTAYKTIQGGNSKNKGTWVCKELVYSYAMWINAKFHIAVIRTFDAVVNDRLASDGYQLGDLQELRNTASARYALGFGIASGGGKVLSEWRKDKQALDAEIAVLDDLMQPLLTGFNETKVLEVVK